VSRSTVLSSLLVRERWSGRPAALAFALLALPALAILRWTAGPAVAGSLAPLAVFPVLALAWRWSAPAALAAAAVFSSAWGLIGLARAETPLLLLLADAFALGASLAAVALALAGARALLEAERNKSLLDPLTGLWNLKSFYRFAEIELSRFRRTRRPFTLLCLDLDEFTLLNSRTDADTADDLLRCTASAVKKSVRVTDVVARVGPDEFAVLMPETGGEKADRALERVQEDVRKKLQQYRWAVSFCLGAVTFENEPADVEDMIRRLRGVIALTKEGVGKDRTRRVCH